MPNVDVRQVDKLGQSRLLLGGAEQDRKSPGYRIKDRSEEI